MSNKYKNFDRIESMISKLILIMGILLMVRDCSPQSLNCPNGQFPDTNKMNCVSCPTAIMGCFTCEVENDQTVCLRCAIGPPPSTDRKQCACDYILNYCNSCLNDNSCTECIGNYFPYTAADTCDNCVTTLQNFFFNPRTSECGQCYTNLVLRGSTCSYCPYQINQCAQCRTTMNLNQREVVCTKCGNQKYPSADKFSCQDCRTRIPNCATCNADETGAVICSACDESYYTSADKSVCDTCENVISDCETCTLVQGITRCSGCVAGYFHSADLRTCVICPNRITNCATCVAGNTITCIACTNNQFPAANLLSCQNCPQIIQKCITCDNNGGSVTCINCQMGFFPDAIGKSCQSCTSVNPNCQTCTVSRGSTGCSLCFDGYFSSSNRNCQQCVSPCKTCNSASSCKSCIDGYYVSGTTCLQTPQPITYYGGVCTVGTDKILCQRGCLVCACSSATSRTCQSAQEGYSINAGSIVKCGSGCATCDPTNVVHCLTCLSLYSLQGDNTCSKCHSSCASCSPRDPNNCLTCPEGFSKNVQNTCSQCSKQHCRICNSNGECSACDNGFFVDSTTQNCQQCISNCDSCLETSIATCTFCGELFYLDGAECKSCPKGCSSCNASGCSSCTTGYTINVQAKTCIKNCEFPCLTCLSDNPNTCQSCVLGYTLLINQCIPNYCTSGCQGCPLETRRNSGVCQNCTTENCALCDVSASICESCLKGFYITNVLSCEACPSICTACESENYCTECIGGYTFVKAVTRSVNNIIHGSCQPCSSPCKTCELSTTKCKTCIYNYTLDGQKCVLQNTVVFVSRLNTDFSTFNSQRHHLSLRAVFIRLLRVSSRSITIKTLRDGSTQVTGQVANQLQTSTSLCSQLSEMRSGLNSGSNIDGMGILESSFISQSNQGIVDCSMVSTSEESGPNLGLILGLAVGIPLLTILILAIVGAIICIDSKRLTNERQQMQNIPKSSETVVTLE